MNDDRLHPLRAQVVQAAMAARRAPPPAGSAQRLSHGLWPLLAIVLTTAPAWCPWTSGAHLDRGLAAGVNDLMTRAARNLQP